ncbi:MAG: flagellar hook-length control protein FliK [Sideroxydans sp.]|jgi:flagellar hook-length control protein FliK
MNNLPILANNAAAPSKATSQTNPNSNPNEANAQDAPPFGDVLARQLFNSEVVEAKTADIAATDVPLLLTTDMVKTENALDATNASLPADMLATLLPVAAVVAQMASTAPNSTVDSRAQGDLEQLTSATSKGTAALPTSSPATPLVANEGLAKTAAPASSAKDNAPALALGANVMAFAKEVEARNKLDLSVTSPSMQVVTPQANLVQSMVNTSPIVAPATQLVIDTPLAQRQWGNEFSQKVTWMATQQDQHAELHLNPAQLGPVDVVIKVSGDQATAQFTSAHAAVREVIEQSIPKLREMLADNGIMLGNATVSDQAPREQRGELGNQRQTAPSGRLLESAPANMSETRVVTPLSRHNGMVDTFA